MRRAKARGAEEWFKPFNDSVVYVYDPDAGPSVGKPALPELVGLLLKAIQYFEIDGRPDVQKQPLPSRETLKTFFANQQLSDGRPPSPRLVSVMVTLCLPLPLMKGGRPSRKKPTSDLHGLHEGMNAHERERVLLQMISGDGQGAPLSDEEAEKP